MAKITITKLDAAKRQLSCAIRMFFANEDPVSVYTLGNAAPEIFEGRPSFRSRRKSKSAYRLFDALRAAYPNLSDQHAWKKSTRQKLF